MYPTISISDGAALAYPGILVGIGDTMLQALLLQPEHLRRVHARRPESFSNTKQCATGIRYSVPMDTHFGK